VTPAARSWSSRVDVGRADRKTVRLALPPLPVAGLPESVKVHMDFDAETADAQAAQHPGRPDAVAPARAEQKELGRSVWRSVPDLNVLREAELNRKR
jgi:hypothetical protein